MKANPLPVRTLPGRLYSTSATREMDRLLGWCREGGWGTFYGPAGAQKTFLLQTRAAECEGDAEPWMVLVEVTGAWSTLAFFRALARELALPILYHSADGFRNSLLRALRRRRSPLAIVIDEADLLYDRVDTLQAVRRFVDVAGRHAGPARKAIWNSGAPGSSRSVCASSGQAARRRRRWFGARFLS